ncbi:MAG: hypothetical protein ACRDFB_03945, partial [Rhabdochlamydiaceae bacterium]
YLTVKDIHNEGLVLVLNDGSEWDIKYFSGGWRLVGWGWTEQQEVSHWTIGDTIEIQYPGSGNLIDFILLITNLSKKEEAWATLRQAPSVDHSACLYVTSFDKETNCVTLSNGTVWFKAATDMYGSAFQQIQKTSISQVSWKTGDTLTVIKARGRLFSDSFMLWNHSTNEMPFVSPEKE